jgi:hypothetical protein
MPETSLDMSRSVAKCAWRDDEAWIETAIIAIPAERVNLDAPITCRLDASVDSSHWSWPIRGDRSRLRGGTPLISIRVTQGIHDRRAWVGP